MLKPLLLSLIIILASSCDDLNRLEKGNIGKTEKSPDNQIVAKIGDDYITRRQLMDSISRLPVKQKILVQSSPKKMNKHIESHINKEVLYKEALARGLDENENIKKSIEEYKKKLLIKSLTEQIFKQEISDKELEQYYGANKEKYKSALVTQVSITPKDRERYDPADMQNVLNKITAQLQKGGGLDDFNKSGLYTIKIRESFEVNRNKYNQILSDSIFNMDMGEVSKPIKLKNSYVIFKILNGPDYIPFKNVKNDIRFQIRNNNFDNYLNNLKDSAGIEIYTDNIYKETNKDAKN